MRRTEKKIVYRNVCLGRNSEKFMVRVQIFQESPKYRNTNLQTQKLLLLQIKMFLLRYGIRKDVAVSVNKESMNKSIALTIYSSGFSFSVTAPFSGYLERRM